MDRRAELNSSYHAKLNHSEAVRNTGAELLLYVKLDPYM